MQKNAQRKAPLVPKKLIFCFIATVWLSCGSGENLIISEGSHIFSCHIIEPSLRIKLTIESF